MTTIVALAFLLEERARSRCAAGMILLLSRREKKKKKAMNQHVHMEKMEEETILRCLFVDHRKHMKIYVCVQRK